MTIELDLSSTEALHASMQGKTPDEIAAALAEKDEYGTTLLHRLANKNNTYMTALALERLSADHRAQLLAEKDQDGATVLHWVANRKGAYLMTVALEGLSADQRAQLLAEKDQDGDTVLHRVARHDSPPLMKVIVYGFLDLDEEGEAAFKDLMKKIKKESPEVYSKLAQLMQMAFPQEPSKAFKSVLRRAKAGQRRSGSGGLQGGPPA